MSADISMDKPSCRRKWLSVPVPDTAADLEARRDKGDNTRWAEPDPPHAAMLPDPNSSHGGTSTMKRQGGSPEPRELGSSPLFPAQPPGPAAPPGGPLPLDGAASDTCSSLPALHQTLLLKALQQDQLSQQQVEQLHRFLQENSSLLSLLAPGLLIHPSLPAQWFDPTTPVPLTAGVDQAINPGSNSRGGTSADRPRQNAAGERSLSPIREERVGTGEDRPEEGESQGPVSPFGMRRHLPVNPEDRPIRPALREREKTFEEFVEEQLKVDEDAKLMEKQEARRVAGGQYFLRKGEGMSRSKNSLRRSSLSQLPNRKLTSGGQQRRSSAPFLELNPRVEFPFTPPTSGPAPRQALSQSRDRCSRPAARDREDRVNQPAVAMRTANRRRSEQESKQPAAVKLERVARRREERQASTNENTGTTASPADREGQGQGGVTGSRRTRLARSARVTSAAHGERKAVLRHIAPPLVRKDSGREGAGLNEPWLVQTGKSRPIKPLNSTVPTTLRAGEGSVGFMTVNDHIVRVPGPGPGPDSLPRDSEERGGPRHSCREEPHQGQRAGLKVIGQARTGAGRLLSYGSSSSDLASSTEEEEESGVEDHPSPEAHQRPSPPSLPPRPGGEDRHLDLSEDDYASDAPSEAGEGLLTSRPQNQNQGSAFLHHPSSSVSSSSDELRDIHWCEAEKESRSAHAHSARRTPTVRTPTVRTPTLRTPTLRTPTLRTALPRNGHRGTGRMPRRLFSSEPREQIVSGGTSGTRENVKARSPDHRPWRGEQIV